MFVLQKHKDYAFVHHLTLHKPYKCSMHSTIAQLISHFINKWYSLIIVFDLLEEEGVADKQNNKGLPLDYKCLLLFYFNHSTMKHK